MRRGRTLHRLAWILMMLSAAGFVAVLSSVLLRGFPDLTWPFLSSWPNEATGGGGILPELINTVVMVGMALLVTAPIGIAVAIYQREYRLKPQSALQHLSATWLAAPTIVVALVVYRVAVGWFHWPVSILTGTLALAVINLPFMVSVAEAAIGGVPDSYRLASLALGASRFETVTRVVLPAAASPLIEGLGMAAARLAGESAALIVTAGVNVSRHFGLFSPGETLAVHIWYIRTEGVALGRDTASAATGVVLLILVTVLLWISRRLARWFE